MKRKDNATTFSDDDAADSDEEEDDSDDGEFLSSDNDISDSDDSDTEGNDRKRGGELPKGSNEDTVALNDSLRRDLDSTLEDSDIVEYGTLEIKKAADEYEESNKPDPNQLQLSREGDLAREAEQEMLRNRRERSEHIDERSEGAITGDAPADGVKDIDESDDYDDWDSEDVTDGDENADEEATSNKII